MEINALLHHYDSLCIIICTPFALIKIFHMFYTVSLACRLQRPSIVSRMRSEGFPLIVGCLFILCVWRVSKVCFSDDLPRYTEMRKRSQ